MSDTFEISEIIVSSDSELATFAAPSINDTGEIAVFGSFDDGDRGIVIVEAGAIDTVVRDSQLEEEFDTLTEDFSFNNNGTLVYTVESIDPETNSGTIDLILDRDGSPTNLSSLDNNVRLIQRYDNFAINDNDIVLTNRFSGAPRVAIRELELFFPDGTSEEIVDGGAVTGGGLDFDRLGTEDINDENTVAYTATDFGEADTSIYTTDERVIPLTTEESTTLSTQKDPVINDAGTIFVNLEQSTGEAELFLSDTGNQLTSLVDNSGSFDTFGEIALNNEETIVFEAVLDDGTEGIFTGVDPESDRLIAVGDSLSGSEVVDLQFNSEGLNNLNTISFQAELADGTFGVYQVSFRHEEINVINGTNRADVLIGEETDDLINGANGADLLIGLAGKDTLEGERGRDVLIGVDPQSSTPGLGEIDVLVGGLGNDFFTLGDFNHTFYDDGDSNTNGNTDYALIEDFKKVDLIVLKGAANDYLLESNFSIGEASGTAIFKQDTENELIAVVKDTENLDLNSNNFFFV